MNESFEQLPPAQSVLSAKNKRQAMDWSLVLVSQGIEHVIQPDAAGKWQLMVPTEMAARANAVIRQYRIENRHWHWRRPVLKQRLMFDWAAGLWVLLVLLFHELSLRRPTIRTGGVMNTQAVEAGEWWRLFTATWLHADLPHLASNAGFGFLLLALAMGRHGTGVGLLAAWLAGVVGNLFSLILHGAAHQSLGASGVVMGALGLLATPARSLVGPTASRSKAVLTALAGTLLLFVLLGVSPESDVAAHLGGFVAGLALGWLLARVPELVTNVPLNFAAGLGFAILVIVTWTRAIRPGG